MTDLIVVCSITNENCYEGILVEHGLKKIGIDYELILTDPNLSLSASYNSIVNTHRKLLEQSKYIAFLSQDSSFKIDNWGKKLLQICLALPDMGYGGVSCKTIGGLQIGYEKMPFLNNPVEVNVCDANIIIIPSWLFLEHQFDTAFSWYPFAEDYALWVQRIKKLKVYHIPLGCYSGGCTKPSKWVSQFKNNNEYATQLMKDHKRLLKKWGLPSLKTTTWG